MHTDLETFLLTQTSLVTETTIWTDGTMHLSVNSYLSQDLPPLHLITSVRAVVLQKDSVLVVRGPSDFYILPGGRREGSEGLLQTLERELGEETGWSVSNVALLGFMHFCHQTPRPLNYPYPYPDFFQVVYATQADHYDEDALLFDQYVLYSDFFPVVDLSNFELKASEFLYLDAALKLR